MSHSSPLDDPLLEFLAQRVALALMHDTTQRGNAYESKEATDGDDLRGDLHPVLDRQAG